MKKIFTSLVLSCSLVFFLASFSGGDGKYPSGAPAGYTNSPHDGQDCSVSSCHGGSSTQVTNYITTNVPADGYVPGTTYNITVTVPGTNGDRKGFEVSPQNTAGTILGTVTPGSGSKAASGAAGYITHSTAVSSSPATWTFTWTAPAAGTGQVTFYGAFVAGFSNVSHSSTVVQESHVGINDLKAEMGFIAYPNPVQNKLTLSYNLKQMEHLSISLFDVTGKLVMPLLNEVQNAGTHSSSFDLRGKVSSGIYFIAINKSGENKILSKIVVR
jgi:hypothetical protein